MHPDLAGRKKMKDADDELSKLERSRQGPDYPSRKNSVFRSESDGIQVVVKVFSGGRHASAASEFQILDRCKAAGIAVPSPLILLDNAIVMEFLEGSTVASRLDAIEAESGLETPDGMAEAESIMQSLGSWLARFHRLHDFRITRGDSIMRNFMLVGSEVYGIDFEESTECDVLIDLGQMCSSLLSMRPMFTRTKLALAEMLSGHYFEAAGTARQADLPAKISEALRYYAKFRSDGDELLAWAEKIERDGLTQTESG